MDKIVFEKIFKNLDDVFNVSVLSLESSSGKFNILPKLELLAEKQELGMVYDSSSWLDEKRLQEVNILFYHPQGLFIKYYASQLDNHPPLSESVNVFYPVFSIIKGFKARTEKHALIYDYVKELKNYLTR